MKRRYPDGPRIHLPLAIVAQMLPRLFPFDALEFSLTIARQFGDIAHYKFGPLHVYYLNHPELARQVLVERAEKFHKPRLVKAAFRPFAGDGLLTSDGALWRQQRRLMQPAFHHRHLEAYALIMTRETARLMESFAEGEIRDIGADMAALTLAIVVQSLFGTGLPRDGHEIGRLMLAFLEAANQRLNAALHIPAWVPTRRNLRERRAIAEVDAMLQAVVRSRRAAGNGANGISREERDDLLSLLLAAADEEGGARMSDEQLRWEMTTLFLAGHETTADALTWTWYLLSRYPEVEAKLVLELERALAGRIPAAADLPNLPYTEMVVRETMRLYPPAPGIAREPVEDVEIGGYEIGKGSLLVVNTYAMHRDERFFANAERFEPERFAPGWEERISRYAYLPFGGGPRVCIGNGFAMVETRLVLATMAQRYKFSLESDEPVTPIQLVTLRPGRAIRMRVRQRQPFDI